MSDIYQNYDEFKKFEIVFSGQDNVIHKVRGKVHSIADSTITIYSSIEKQKAIDIPEGTAVKVYVYTESGIYYADSNVISTVKDEKFIVYMLTYPTNNKHSQRREFFRADMRIPLNVTVVKSVLSGIKYSFEATSKDICGNGIALVSENKITDHEDIYIAIQFPEKTVETSAKIVHAKERDVRGVTYYTYALTFTSIAPRDIDFIVKKCFLYQLKLKNME